MLQPLLEAKAADAFYVDGVGHETLATPGGGLNPVKGNHLHDRSIQQARETGSFFGSVQAPLGGGDEARVMKVVVSEPGGDGDS